MTESDVGKPDAFLRSKRGSPTYADPPCLPATTFSSYSTMLPATRNYVPWTTHLRSEEPSVSPTEQLRALLRSVPSPPPGDIQTEQIPALKNYLEPCRLVLSPVLLHDAHDALVANAEALLQAIITKFPPPPAFNKSLPSVIRNITTALNSALLNAQLQAHVDDGVTLYLHAPTSHSLLALAMPHSHSDDEVTALLATLNDIHVNGAVSPCSLQPVLNNVPLVLQANNSSCSS